MKNFFRSLWLRFRGIDEPRTAVSREQRYRRLATAERVQGERFFGEWWQ